MIFMRVFIWYWCLHEIVQEIIMQFMYIEWTINQLYNREQTTDSNAKGLIAIWKSINSIINILGIF